MALNIWTKPSGTSLGTFQERTHVENILLPVNNTTDISFTLISGSLPHGMYLEKHYITGFPYEVSMETTCTFCIRASDKQHNIADRTFTITISGADAPVITTPADRLTLYNDNRYYALDQTIVEYQINAYDYDTAAGQQLSFFIASNEGILPPGLTLSTTGLITGYIKETPAIQLANNNGTYDNGPYDSEIYDFAAKPSTGYDSFPYDSVGYDFSYPEAPIKKLNRNYPFIVTVTDGTTVVKKQFSIMVIADNYFRTDNSAMRLGDAPFTANASYVRTPVWKTTANLGSHRADNYLIIPIEVYDTSILYYAIDDISKLPPGMKFDYSSGSIYGTVPYQSYLSKEYTFTVRATRRDFIKPQNTVYADRTFTITILGTIYSEINWITPADLGTLYVDYNSTLSIVAENSKSSASGIVYSVVSGKLPSGLSLLISGEIVGKPTRDNLTIYDVTYQQTTFDFNLTTWSDVKPFDPPVFSMFDNETTTFDRTFEFTVEASDRFAANSSRRTFIINIDIHSYIHYSNITVSPLLTQSQRNLWEQFISDQTIFIPENLYRSNDKNFGIFRDLSMIVYSGIESVNTAMYMTRFNNFKQTTLLFDSINVANAVDTVTKEILYEVVYILMIDTTNSIHNWQQQIKSIGYTERNFLPLWMRTIQTNQRTELGYITAVPLCICNVGKSADIVTNIKLSNFDFTQLDYCIDRLIIDQTLDSNTAKYLSINK
jgi:hypothetical protein